MAKTDHRNTPLDELELLSQEELDKALYNEFAEKSVFNIDSDYIKKLIKSGANTNIYNEVSKINLLHYLIDNKIIDLIETVLSNGSDVNAKDAFGWTPLHYASLLEEVGVIQILLDAGADIDVKDIWGETPIFWAMDNHIKQDTLIYLIKAGADLDIMANDQTPLHHAVIDRNIGVIKALIAAGADLNVRAEDGWTALHISTNMHIMSDEYIDIIKTLIKSGADINAKNNEGNIPWDLANDEMKNAVPELNPSYNG